MIFKITLYTIFFSVFTFSFILFSSPAVYAHDWHDPQRDNASVYDPKKPGLVSMLINIDDDFLSGSFRMKIDEIFVESELTEENKDLWDEQIQTLDDQLHELLIFESREGQVNLDFKFPHIELYDVIDDVGHEEIEFEFNFDSSEELRFLVPTEWETVSLVLSSNEQFEIVELSSGDEFTISEAGNSTGESIEDGQEDRFLTGLLGIGGGILIISLLLLYIIFKNERKGEEKKYAREDSNL